VPAGDWPAPQLAGDGEPAGPVLVTTEYHAVAGHEAELLAALEDARFSRRRTGASSWRVWQDSTAEDRILEQFVVASWDEHLRQHERVSKRDQERYTAIRALTDPARPARVTHWLTPLSGRARRAAERQARAEGQSGIPGTTADRS
jgi:Transmembrane secretion effector